MFKRFSANYMAMLCLLDCILVQVSLWVAMWLRFLLKASEGAQFYWHIIPVANIHLAIAVVWPVSFLLLSVYTPRKIVRWIDELQRVLLAHTTAALCLAGLLYLSQVSLPRLTFGYFYLTALLSFLGYRFLLRAWHRQHRKNPRSVARILVVGAGKIGQDIVGEFARQQWPGVEFIGFVDDDPEKQKQYFQELPVLGKLEQMVEIVRNYDVDEVLFALPARAHSRLANAVAILQQQPVRVRVVPDYFELAFFGATVESLGGIPLIGLRDPAIDGFQRLIKRVMDMIVSTCGLLLLSPLLIATAIAIKLEDGGPILYRADRVGENGRLFRMLKFRSMVAGADKIQFQVNQVDAQGHLVHKSRRDPRVTYIGSLIRRTSIDELPQLINVFKGEMSLVGPRPELPWLVAKYEPWQHKRFAVPQGITGWWQVNGRSDNLMHLHTEHDLYYIQNYSLWLDMQILWKTVAVVLRGKGAY